MAQTEMLVSNCYYKGEHVGSIKLDVMDTSIAPGFTITVEDDANKPADVTQLEQLGTYKFKLQLDDLEAGTTKVYATLESDDGKITGQFDNSLRAAFSKDTTVDLDASGEGIYTLPLDFFPSLLGYVGKLSFYTTEERKILIREFNLTVLPLTSATLKVTCKRLIDNPAALPATLVFGDEIAFILEAKGKTSLVTGTDKIMSFHSSIGGDPIDIDNPWIESLPTDLGMAVSIDSNDVIRGASGLYVTKASPLDSSDQLVEVSLGELKASNTMVVDVTLFSATRLNTDLDWRAHILPDSNTGPIFNWIILMLQGTSLNLGQMGMFSANNIIRGVPADSAWTGLLRPPTFENIEQPYIGLASLLGWDSTKITNALARLQFGSYQNSMNLNYPTVNSVTWDEINSNDLTPGDKPLKDRDLVVMALPDTVSVAVSFIYDQESMKFFIKDLDGVTRDIKEFRGRLNLLFLNKVVKNNYEENAPYPRVIVADIVDFTETNNLASAEYIKPTDLDIDLTDERYQIATNLETVTELTNFTTQRKLTRYSDKLGITLGEVDTGTEGRLHLTIWDLGPGVAELDRKQEVFGNVKPVAASTWTNTELDPDLAVDKPTLHLLRTVGTEPDLGFLEANKIERTADDELIVTDYTNSDLDPFVGQSGIVVWDGTFNKSPMFNPQMPFFQKSLRVKPDANGEYSLKLADVTNTEMDQLMGTVKDFTTFDVSVFITCESPTTSIKTKVVKDSFDIKVVFKNASDDTWINILVLRDGLNTVNTANENVGYPRILGVNKMRLQAGVDLNLDLNTSLKIDGQLPRYQAAIQLVGLKGTSFETVPFGAIDRDVNQWAIKPSGLVMDDFDANVAIIDYGPDTPPDTVNPITPPEDPGTIP